MNTPKPYNEKRNGNIIYRNFSQDIDESELIWHRDKEDRYVKVLNESDWGFQMDNELPIRLKKGTELFIPKETYHRVLKGRSDLNILIKENYNPTDVDILFKQNPDLEKSVYVILGYNKEIDDKNYEVRKAKYAAQNRIMSDKQVSFANGRGLDRTIRELRNINTPESNIVADLIEVERVNIKAKQFNTKTDEGKLKSKEQYDIKNRLLDNVFKQYRKNGWDVKYERSSIPGVAHTLFFTIPDTDIQLSYHGNYENISKYFNSLPEGRWDGIPGATFHKLEEAALDIINENNIDKTDWRKGIDLGQEFIQLPYTYTEQQKQEAREIYSEYLQNNPEGDLEGFKEYINSKNLQLETMEISKKDLIQNWLNNPKKLKEDVEQFEITKGELEEEKKKADRCLRIARRKMPQTSAYRSGLIVQCRRGKIWKKGK